MPVVIFTNIRSSHDATHLSYWEGHMKNRSSITILSILVGVFAIIQAAAGLFVTGGRDPFEFTSLRGETVLMNGRGIYALDTFFKASLFQGTDAMTLFVGVPLLIIALIYFRKGTLRSQILLTGVLSYFLYNSTSVVMGAAYNNLLLVYIAFFSLSLFAFIVSINSIDLEKLTCSISDGFPRKGTGILLIFTSVALLAAWLGDILTPLITGSLPKIASYTTEITYALDLGIITPVCLLAGIQTLRRKPAGYLLSPIMMILLIIVGVLMIFQTVFQLSAGVALTPGEIIGKSASFTLLAFFALWMTIRYFRAIK